MDAAGARFGTICAVASLVFVASAPAGSVFGILPAAGDAARGATESAFLSAYSAAQGFSALWCFAAAFAVASLLALLALVTLAVKSFIEWRAQDLHLQPLHEGQ